MLFATDATGDVYAFSTAGVLQPVFVNGATSVATGLDNARGLAFSTLDENLFHVTPAVPYTRAANSMDVRLGHATQEGNAIVVDERQFDPGHEGWQFGTSSLHFGQGRVPGQPGGERRPHLRLPRRGVRLGRQQGVQPEGLRGRRSADFVLQLLPGHRG